jgi:hypothetical protein
MPRILPNLPYMHLHLSTFKSSSNRIDLVVYDGYCRMCLSSPLFIGSTFFTLECVQDALATCLPFVEMHVVSICCHRERSAVLAMPSLSHVSLPKSGIFWPIPRACISAS